MVYDLDGDGRAEVACKTADGTIDGAGKAIGDADGRPRQRNGRILDGPEYLTVFDGTDRRGAGDDRLHSAARRRRRLGRHSGNRVDRFLACVAYLDGERPSLVMCRGYYTRAVLAAWDWRDGKLTHVWTFDSDDGTPGNDKYRGQGNHNISVGRRRRRRPRRDHLRHRGDRRRRPRAVLHRPGPRRRDARDRSRPRAAGPGSVQSQRRRPQPGGHPDARRRTGEQILGRAVHAAATAWAGRARWTSIRGTWARRCWGAGQGVGGLFDARGNRSPSAAPRGLQHGRLVGRRPDARAARRRRRVASGITRAAGETPLFAAADYGCVSNNGSKSNPCLCADILGDWREEIVARERDGRRSRSSRRRSPPSIASRR